jgi:hypothetical protein
MSEQGFCPRVTGSVQFAASVAEARFPSPVTEPRDLARLVRAAAIWRGELRDFIPGAIVAGAGRVYGLGFAKGLI